jgi:hypothetical protein
LKKSSQTRKQAIPSAVGTASTQNVMVPARVGRVL